MRKLSRTDPSLDFIRPFTEFCKDGFRSYEPHVIREFGEHVIQGVAASVSKLSRRDGIRAELLFQTVVAGLGHVKILKAEDTGDVFCDGEEAVSVPDFTIVTKAGARLLVEVKLAAKTEVYKLSDNRMQNYIRYAEIMGGVLFFAVFWQDFGIWTLNNLEAFTAGATNVKQWSLSYWRALATNELHQLGDKLLAATPPFRFRMHCKPIPIPEGLGEADIEFEVSKVEILWRSQVLKGNTQEFVWKLMCYGGWPEVSKTCIVRDGIMHGVDFVIAPPNPDEDWDEDQSRGASFSVIAPLSSLISKAYLDGAYSTIHTSNPDTLLEPGACHGFIPDDLEIPLGRGTWLPNYEYDPALLQGSGLPGIPAGRLTRAAHTSAHAPRRGRPRRS